MELVRVGLYEEYKMSEDSMDSTPVI